MFNSFRYLFFFLFVLTSIWYVFDFMLYKEWYEYVGNYMYEVDVLDLIDWDAIDWDNVDMDLLEEYGPEYYFGLDEQTVQPQQKAMSFSQIALTSILFLCLGIVVVGFKKIY